MRPQHGKGIPIQELAQRKQLAQHRFVDPADEGPRIGFAHDQALLDEFQYRLAHGPAADAQAMRKLQLYELCPGRDLPGENRVPQHLSDLRSSSPAQYEFELRQRFLHVRCSPTLIFHSWCAQKWLRWRRYSIPSSSPGKQEWRGREGAPGYLGLDARGQQSNYDCGSAVLSRGR